MTQQTQTHGPQAILEANKKTVREFYGLAFNQKRAQEAVNKYVGATYRQHNPTAPDGPKAFVEFVGAFTQQFPNLKVTPKRWVAEGDLVVVHSLLQPDPKGRGMAAVDIFRLENGKIVEHWDVLQEIPEKSANTNTMF